MKQSTINKALREPYRSVGWFKYLCPICGSEQVGTKVRPMYLRDVIDEVDAYECQSCGWLDPSFRTHIVKEA